MHCKTKLSQLQILRQPASADFLVFSTCCFKFILQNVEKFLQKLREFRNLLKLVAVKFEVGSTCFFFVFFKCGTC